MGNFEVENNEIKNSMQKIGKIIAMALPKGWGFTLLIWSKGEGGSMFYISNGNRQDVIASMREFIEKQIS